MFSVAILPKGYTSFPLLPLIICLVTLFDSLHTTVQKETTDVEASTPSFAVTTFIWALSLLIYSLCTESAL